MVVLQDVVTRTRVIVVTALLALPAVSTAALRLELVAGGFTNAVAFVPDPLV